MSFVFTAYRSQHVSAVSASLLFHIVISFSLPDVSSVQLEVTYGMLQIWNW